MAIQNFDTSLETPYYTQYPPYDPTVAGKLSKLLSSKFSRIMMNINQSVVCELYL